MRIIPNMIHAEPWRMHFLASAVVRDARPLAIALAGGGCSPRIYDGVSVNGCLLLEVDWMQGPGPYTPEAVAGRLAEDLSRRAAPTVLLGHSLGGVIVLLTALLAPAVVQAVVVSNTGPHTRDHGDTSLPERIRSRWTREVRRAFLQACFFRAPPPALMRELEQYLDAQSPDALLEAIEGLRRIDLSADLPSIRCPALVAHGEFDRRRGVVDARRLVALIPGAELVLLPGGHTPMVDCVDAYNDALNAFLARHLRATQSP